MGDFGNSEECGDFGESGECDDSGDFGSSGDSCDSLKSSDSGEWGKLGGNRDFGNSGEYCCSGETCEPELLGDSGNVEELLVFMIVVVFAILAIFVWSKGSIPLKRKLFLIDIQIYEVDIWQRLFRISFW